MKTSKLSKEHETQLLEVPQKGRYIKPPALVSQAVIPFAMSMSINCNA